MIKEKNLINNALLTYKLSIFIFLIICIFDSAVTFALSRLIGNMFDIASTENNVSFYNVGLKLIIILFLIVINNYILKFIENRFTKKVQIKIRKNLFKFFYKLNLNEFFEQGENEINSSMLNDVNIIESSYISNIIAVTKNFVMVLVTIVLMVQISFGITIFVLIVSCLPIFSPSFFMKKLNLKMGSFTESMESYNLKLSETLDGYLTFKTYGLEKLALQEHSISNERLSIKKKKAYYYIDLIGQVATIVAILAIYSVLFVGMYLVIDNKITIGMMFSLTFISMSIIGPIGELVDKIPKIISAKVLVNKYKYKEEAVQASKDSNDIEEIKISGLALSFNKPILEDINIKFEKNKKYALIGESGSGKSTVFKILLKIYNDYKGEIFINEHNLKNIIDDDLYKNISYIPQSNNFFDGTIKDNLTFYDDNISEDKIKKYLEISKIDEKVMSLENNINYIIKDNGSNFSGGEKQRLAIARALIQDRQLLILDEATSALDNETFKIVENNILSLENKTLLNITHRIDKDILAKYDEIIVMKNGKIVEKGSFDTLIENKNYFYELYYKNNNY